MVHVMLINDCRWHKIKPSFCPRPATEDFPTTTKPRPENIPPPGKFEHSVAPTHAVTSEMSQVTLMGSGCQLSLASMTYGGVMRIANGLLSSTMTLLSLPREILDDVAQKVADLESLKALSLSASQFRAPCQRILLRSLTLNHQRHANNYTPARILLCGSPHVASYITTLNVQLSEETTFPALRSLRIILGQLQTVRRCRIEGDSGACCWDDLLVAPDVVEFIRRQPLEELHVLFLRRVPIPVLALLFSSAPKLSFHCIYVRPDGEAAPTHARSTPSHMTHLRLSIRTQEIWDALARPRFANYAAHLRKLTLHPAPEHSGIIPAVTHTLEHICFDCLSLLKVGSILPLPPLTSLRSIELIIHFGGTHEAWLGNNLPRLLTSAPATLEMITVTYGTIHHFVRFPLVLQPETMSMLDGVLSHCSTPPCIRWRLSFEGDDRGERLAAFTMCVQMGLPWGHERGKVIV
ncbi:hypothetical protein DFH07DRAFT_771641 [Mycena maculata]|uniref:F-box domain-containing protein n=1 Tax=Mycena maculata TaxID=230809 RepID=A0AAD7NI14_9AGAR|nr:hypothetical protein DFH07DRAFT_771641 [Mycena maculata]